MRLIDADKTSEYIKNGPGTNLQKFFADCCIAAAPTINPYEWISVDDRLPEKFTNVLCLYPSKTYGCNIVVDYMESDRGYFSEQFRYGTPTHWMPLPAIPDKL